MFHVKHCLSQSCYVSRETCKVYLQAVYFYWYAADDIINVNFSSFVYVFSVPNSFNIGGKIMTSIGTVISHLFLAIMGVAQYVIIIAGVILMVYLLRITRWYIKKHNVPPLFGNKIKKDKE